MGGSHNDARPHSVRIEPWEIEVARSVARSFKTFPEHEDLEAELLKRLLELKSTRRHGVRDWRGFLAKSLYNAANNVVARWKWRDRRMLSLELRVAGEDEDATLESVLAEPDERPDLEISFAEVWQDLSPDLRDLWHLLVEEEGNVLSVARRLGQSRGTVRGNIRRIKALLGRFGLDET